MSQLYFRVVGSDRSPRNADTQDADCFSSDEEENAIQKLDTLTTTLLERHPVRRPYRCMLPVPLGPDGRPSPVPPHDSDKLEAPETRQPIVDLRRETFNPSPLSLTKKARRSPQELHDEAKSSHLLHTSGNIRIIKPLEGPVPLKARRKTRIVNRYRILDQHGNEVLLYINSEKNKQKDPFGTEVENTGRGPFTYWDTSRRPLPKVTTLPGVASSFNRAEEIERRKQLLGKHKKRKKEPKFRFAKQGTIRRGDQSCTTSHSLDNNLLHPDNFSSSCFPACMYCNDPYEEGIFSERGVPGLCKRCCPASCCRCVPAMTMRELFCCGNNMDEGAGMQSVSGFTRPSKVLAVQVLPRRPKGQKTC